MISSRESCKKECLAKFSVLTFLVRALRPGIRNINESSLKTSNFGLKPGKWLIFNCLDLKVEAIDMRDNQGFSHINEIY